MSDTDLQIALAKMLPELLEPRFVRLSAVGTDSREGYWVVWWRGRATAVLDTEWLHVCWLVEQNLSEEEHSNFRKALRWPIESKQPALTKYGEFKRLYYSASWRQRAAALCKIKGIK